MLRSKNHHRRKSGVLRYYWSNDPVPSKTAFKLFEYALGYLDPPYENEFKRPRTFYPIRTIFVPTKTAFKRSQHFFKTTSNDSIKKNWLLGESSLTVRKYGCHALQWSYGLWQYGWLGFERRPWRCAAQCTTPPYQVCNLNCLSFLLCIEDNNPHASTAQHTRCHV